MALTKIQTEMAAGGPAFSAYQSASQTIATNTSTKILFQTENFDTNNNFASSTFTPTVAGYYQFNWRVGCNAGSGTEIWTSLYKNGANTVYGLDANGGSIYGSGGSAILYANGTTDYFEIYFQQYSGASRTSTALSNETVFSASMIRSA